MRGQKGITLVALIITIVVLLILAVVAITAVTNTDLFNQSRNAANAWTEAEKTQNNTLNNQANLLGEYVNNVTSKY